MTAKEIDALNKEQLERNPSINFQGIPNLTVQTGNQSIAQLIDEFDRAGRAIMVANADQNFPEVPGLRLYPDKIEAMILEREINAEILIARKRLEEDQEASKKKIEAANEKNAKELERLRAMVKEAEAAEKGETTKTTAAE